jgi:hypothetical protein
MDDPAKTIEELMADLRRDVEQWKRQLAKLGDDHADIAARIREWIDRAERVLSQFPDG